METAYYNTCPDCGSNLDPGEHCGCKVEKGQQDEAQQGGTIEESPSQREL